MSNIPPQQNSRQPEKRVHYDVEEIKAKLDIVTVIGSYIPLKGQHRSIFATCPFHANDNTPSLNVRKDLQRYRCYACGAHGDVIQFIADYEKLDWYSALKKAAEMASVSGVPASSTHVPERKTKPEPPKKPDFKWQRLRHQIEHSKESHAYFASRGVVPEVVEAMGIGPDAYASNANWNGVYEMLEGQKFHFPKVPYYNMPYTVYSRLLAVNARRDDLAAQKILDSYDKNMLAAIRIDMRERDVKKTEARRQKGEYASYRWESETDITDKEMMDKIWGSRFRQWSDAPGPYIHGLENLLTLENGSLQNLPKNSRDYILIVEGEICRLSAMSAVRDHKGNWTGGYRALALKWDNLTEKYKEWLVKALKAFTVTLIIEDTKGGDQFSLPLYEAIKGSSYTRILRPPEGCNDLNDIITQGKLTQFFKPWYLRIIPREELLPTTTVRDYYRMAK